MIIHPIVRRQNLLRVCAFEKLILGLQKNGKLSPTKKRQIKQTLSSAARFSTGFYNVRETEFSAFLLTIPVSLCTFQCLQKSFPTSSQT